MTKVQNLGWYGIGPSQNLVEAKKVNLKFTRRFACMTETNCDDENGGCNDIYDCNFDDNDDKNYHKSIQI